MPEDDVTIVVNGLRDALREARSFALCLERPRPEDVARWQKAIDNAAEFLRPILRALEPRVTVYVVDAVAQHPEDDPGAILREESAVNEQIVVSLVDGRAVVQEAPEHSWTIAEFLAEVALGRGRDAYVTDGEILSIGVIGMGLGRVHYKIGNYDPEWHNYPLTLLSGHHLRPLRGE